MVLFIVTPCLCHSPWSLYDVPGWVAVAAMGAAFIGLVLGIAGVERNERARHWAIVGIVANGAWLVCGGIFLLAFLPFVLMPRSSWH
jgi:hypothetical protein